MIFYLFYCPLFPHFLTYIHYYCTLLVLQKDLLAYMNILTQTHNIHTLIDSHTHTHFPSLPPSLHAQLTSSQPCSSLRRGEFSTLSSKSSYFVSTSSFSTLIGSSFSNSCTQWPLSPSYPASSTHPQRTQR